MTAEMPFVPGEPPWWDAGEVVVPPAEHRTVLVVDVSAFGDLRRTDDDRLTIRRGLYALLQQAFEAAGVSWGDCKLEDRGDGVLVVIPATVPKSLLVELLPACLVTALRAYNNGRPGEERMRLRLALHAGEVHHDAHGVVGHVVNLTFRLLDATPFKEAHDQSAGLLSMITSDWFYSDVIQHNRAARRQSYRRVRVVAKETNVPAWVRLVDGEPEPETATDPPAASAVHQLPPSTRLFVGRDAELTSLTELVDGRGAPGPAAAVTIATIDGMAGIGKTALALTWAHRVSDRFPDGQLHVNLRGFDECEPTSADQALHGFLHALGVSAQAIPADLDAKSALFRSLLAGRRMLIVLDNARSSEHVRPLLPGSPMCLVVVTSRNRLDSLVVRDGARRIALDVMSDEEALALLAERVDRARLDAEPDAARELIGLCVRLPLALSVVAGRAASQPSLSIGELVGELRAERRRLDGLDLGDADLSPRAVFSWSYRVLGSRAARTFRLLGIHPGADIGLAACRALAGDQVTGPVRELVSAHLLTEHAPRRFRLHDLLRAYAAEMVEDDPERPAAADRVMTYYLSTALLADRLLQPHRYGREGLDPAYAAGDPDVDDYAAAIGWFTAEHLTVQAMVGFAAEHGSADRAWRLAWAATTFLRRTGRWTERVAVHRTALAAVRAGGDTVGEAVASRHLAQAVARLGRFDEAIRLLDRAAEIYRSRRDRRGGFKNHLAYGRVLDAAGNHREAFDHARTALELIRDEDDRLGRADALNAVGRQLFLLEHHDQAGPMCAQALRLYMAIGHSEGEASVLLNLGDIERARNRHTIAVMYYRGSLEIDSQLGDRYWTAVSLERLADAYADTGDPKSVPTLREALRVYREIGHPNAGRVRARLADQDGP